MDKSGYKQAGGFILAASIIAGVVGGIVIGQPSIGFLVGAAAGLLVATLVHRGSMAAAAPPRQRCGATNAPPRQLCGAIEVPPRHSLMVNGSLRMKLRRMARIMAL